MKKLLKTITENLHLKIISLVLGILVWANAVTDDVSVYRLNFTVKYITQGLGDSLQIVSQLPEKANVSIKATGKTYIKLNFSRREVIKTLKGLKVGTNDVRFTEEDLPIPLKEVEVLAIEPELIRLEVDSVVRRKVPIRPEDLVITDEFVEVVDVKVTPDSILVIGPSLLVKKLQYVQTEKVVVRNLEDTLHTVGLKELPSEFFKIENQKQKCQVKLTLRPLALDTISIPTKFKQKIQVIVLKSQGLKISQKDLKIKMIPMDTTGPVKFYKPEIITPLPIKIKAVIPEIVTSQ